MDTPTVLHKNVGASDRKYVKLTGERQQKIGLNAEY